MKTLSEIEVALRARESVLLARVSTLEATLDEPGDPDIEEQASNRQSDEALEGVEDLALAEIKDIRHALGRIAAGTYGRCIKCGDEIGMKRLSVLPHAEDCISCA